MKFDVKANIKDRKINRIIDTSESNIDNVKYLLKSIFKKIKDKQIQNSLSAILDTKFEKKPTDIKLKLVEYILNKVEGVSISIQEIKFKKFLKVGDVVLLKYGHNIFYYSETKKTGIINISKKTKQFKGRYAVVATEKEYSDKIKFNYVVDCENLDTGTLISFYQKHENSDRKNVIEDIEVIGKAEKKWVIT